MPEFTLPSGARLSVTPAPFEDVMDLKTAIGNAIGKFALSSDFVNADMSLSGILTDPTILSELADKIKTVAISKDVRAALFKCFTRVTYNDVKVTRDTFDDPKSGDDARKDYYAICTKVIEVNLRPFFELTFSGLKKFAQTQPVIQK